MPIDPERFAQAKRAATAPAREVLERLHAVLLAATPLTLADGSVLEISSLFAPEVDGQGVLACGVDVRLPDGGELEFTLTNSGWGQPLPPLAGKPRKGPPRSR